MQSYIGIFFCCQLILAGIEVGENT